MGILLGMVYVGIRRELVIVCVFFWVRWERIGGGIYVIEWGKVCDFNFSVNFLWLFYLVINYLIMIFSFLLICVWLVYFVLRERYVIFVVFFFLFSYKWVLVNC